MKNSHTIYTSFAKRLVMLLIVLMTIGIEYVFGIDYVLCTSATDLVAGANYAIGTGTDGNVYFMSTETQSNYRKITSISVNNSKVTATNSMMVLTLEGSSGAWTFKTTNYTSTNGFLNTGSTTSNNYLYVNQSNDKYKYFTISFNKDNSAVITCTGKSSRNLMRYNSQDTRISCYSSGQAAIYLYKEVTSNCKYTVQFDSNGGTGTMSDQTFTCDVAQKLTANSFSRTGHTFAGWATTANGSVAYTNQQSVSNLAANGETITLFAQWTPNKYTVNFTASPNGYGTVSQSSIANVPYGTTVTDNSNEITINGTTVTANPAEKDANYSYSFNNWSDVPNTITGTCTITANFTRTERELTNYRTTCTTETSQLATPNVKLTSYDCTSATIKWDAVTNASGYWYQIIKTEETKSGESSGNTTYTHNNLEPGTSYTWSVQALGNKTNYTDSEIATGTFTTYYSITYNTNEGSEVENGCGTNLPNELPETTRSGHTFLGWFTDESCTQEATPGEAISTNTNLYAKWEVAKTPTSLSWSAATYAATIDADNTFPTLTKTPADLSSIAYSSSNTSVATIDANGNITLLKKGETTITATFEETATHTGATDSYTLTVNPSNCRWVETEIVNIQPEDEVVVTMTNGITTWALDQKLSDQNYPLATEVSVIGTEIQTLFDDIKWNISGNAIDGYILYPEGNNDRWLYCGKSTVKIGTSIDKAFSIVNGFFYHVNTTDNWDRYLAVANNAQTPDWRTYEGSQNVIEKKSQTLKFYKKTCLPADEYWINYNLSNVACTTDPKPISVNSSDSELRIFFEPVDGYQLPKEIEVKMGEQILDEESYTWDNTNGKFVIEKSEDISFSMGDVTISIIACKSMDNPADLRTNVTSTTATLSWNTVENAQNYTLLVISDDDISYSYETTLSETTCLIKGLTPNTTYLWEVVANGVDGYCDTHTDDTFTTLDVYTVTFNTNGGTAVASQTVDHGGKATKPANPTKTGYTFAGWYTEADAEFDFNTPIESATTLYAKWNANQYTITFLKQYGSGGTNNATVTFNSNNFSVVTIELPTRDGYEFGGYYTETGGAGLQIVDAEGKWLKNKTGYLDASGNWIKAESVNLYAKWTKIHTITWVVNNNTETPHHTSRALDGSTIDALPMPPADDLFEDCEVNAFVGWSTDNIGLEPDATAPTDLFKTIAEAQSKIGAINGDKKFYAVYASEIESTTTFKRVHELSELNTSSKIAIINAFNKTKYILPTSLEAEATTPSENLGEITIGDGQYWNIEKDGDNWKFKSGNKYLAGTTIPTNNNKIGALALRESEDNTTWTIVKNTYEENGTPVFTIYNTDNTTAGLEYSNGWILYYATDFNTSWFTLNLYIPRTTYSNYITRCTALPDPVWGGATIDKTEIAVNCGETSSTNGAAKISFLKETNFNLYKDITVEVTSGNFIIATSRDGEYSTSVTLTPTQSGTNVGTLDGKYVYVRAVAPAMSDEDFTGTITISGKQLAQDQVIEVTAEVSCTQYTLTFNDQRQTKTVEGFAGTSVVAPEPWAGICTEPIQYVFDGWAETPVANGTEEYEKINFSTYTMPGNNTTVLYAVYRYAEEGGEPVDGFVKVTEALSDWTGDYVIVNETAKKAIGNEYAYTNTLTAVDVEITDNHQVQSPTNNIIWQIRKHGEYYTMYNESARKYAYVDRDKTEGAGLSSTITGTTQDIQIIFNSGTAKVSGVGYYRCFYYNSDKIEWRTYATDRYNTGALYRFSEKTLRYTSSLICGAITAEDALVTSTKEQTVKVKVPITLESSTGATTINATSDNAAFDVTGLTDVEEGDHTIVIEYTPAEYNITETANITLSATNGATTTFTVSGRSLPENFVIATKVGATWYALPANINGATNPEGVLIDVDETTMTATAPNTTVYTLFPVKTTTGYEDRYAQYGDRVRFSAVNNGYNGLWTSSSESTIRNYAVIDDVKDGSSDASYEWKVTTTIVDGNWQYTLQTDQSNNQKYLRYWTAASGGAKWGTYASGNDKLYFLPVTETKPFDYKVVEWYPTKVLIQTDAAITNPIVKIGGILVDNVTCTNKGGKLYEISGLSLAENPTKVLTLSYTADEVTYTNSKVVPIILSRETKSISGEPFVALTKEVYNYADLVVRDGATLTMDGTQEANTLWDVTIYPTSKISVPESKKLTVHSLTFFGGIDDIYDGEKYTTNKYGVPQLSLKGTLGKTVTTMDYIMRVDLEQMYQVGVPYDVNLEEITYWDGTSIELGTALYVSAYDGAARARLDWDNTWQWEVNFVDKVLKAGIGYTISAEPQVAGDTYSILRMPMKNNINSGNTETQKATINVTAHGMSDENLTDNHKGWNYLSNPYMTSISGAESGGVDNNNIVVGYLVETGKGPWKWKNDTYRYVTIPYDDGTNYYQRKFSEATLLPFKSFFLQIANSGDLSFALASRLNAPMRHLQQQENASREVEFELLLSNDAQSDNTGLLISEEFTPAYEINADLEKMTGTMSVYTIYNGYQLAYNALSPLNAMEEIPLGYVVPTTGEYTFNLDERGDLDDIEHIYLLDHDSSITTDLMEDIYTFTATEKKNDHRFAISVILKAEEEEETPTHLETLEWESDHPYKFIYQDKMYILRNGVIYDAMGKQVQTINK